MRSRILFTFCFITVLVGQLSFTAADIATSAGVSYVACSASKGLLRSSSVVVISFPQLRNTNTIRVDKKRFIKTRWSIGSMFFGLRDHMLVSMVWMKDHFLDLVL